jgi:hypothetical protein
MHSRHLSSPLRLPIALLLALGAHAAWAQRGGGFGGGGPGGTTQNRPLVGQYDADKNGRLDATERARALESLANTNAGGGGRGGRGGGGRGGNRPPASPGVKLTPADVKSYPASVSLYDPATLRTVFIQFDTPDWEAEMVAFNNTDVDLPAVVTVDGKTYKDVGVHFRGNSSFGVGNGYKRSLNLSFDFVDEKQDLLGYRTVNFLNANDDPTFLRTVLSLQIARQYIPAPKANLIRVVINGENWGIYANAQQFNKEFIEDNFKGGKGARWKIPQGSGNLGGFRYAGDNAEAYKSTFQIKSKDEPASWAALLKAIKTLNDTPGEGLEVALAPLVNLDGYLRFLALDNVMAGGDGFYSRAADYSLYLDPAGRLNFTFHDANEMFSTGGGRGGPGGGGGGTGLSPLATANDSSKPIIAKILAVPALRAKYLGYVREIADKSLDWTALGPVVKQYRELIAEDVARDTRKLASTEEFLSGTSDTGGAGSLRDFMDRRRAFLLDWRAPAAAAP